MIEGMNFRERNTNEETLICQGERTEKMVPMAGESQQQKREVSSMLTSIHHSMWGTRLGWGVGGVVFN